MRVILIALALASASFSQPLEGTLPLERQGDIAGQMVEGITRWLIGHTQRGIPARSPSRERLRKILGVVDARAANPVPQLLAEYKGSALVAETPFYRVYAVRWPVLAGLGAEGLLFDPRRPAVARVVAVPDADQLPEDLAVAQVFAVSGCQVLVPVLIDRKDTWSGNPAFRMTNQPHREFVYRMAFMVGRHIWGYETQKVLAAVDWFAAQPERLPVGVWGYGEGGAVALFSAALDDRIAAAGVSGYFGPREGLWKQPLYRNVFGLLRDFGDAELASLIGPRGLVVETAPGPSVAGPPPPDSKRRGAAPGAIEPFSAAAVEREFARAKSISRGTNFRLTADGVTPFLELLGATRHQDAPVRIATREPEARLRRQFDEMVEYTQRLMRGSERVRNALWAKTEGMKPAEWEEAAPRYKSMLWDDVIGRLPQPDVPLNPRTRKSYSGEKWDGYEVTHDVLPDVFGYGVLLLPKDIRPGERRPVVVGQHGLEGRPQHLFGLPENDREKGAYTSFHFYQNIGSKMADLGYVVYLPQNPYIGDFRKINRLANPMGLSLFSFILGQHDRMLDWLSSLPYVDPKRIGFYGLSYGGKTAVRVPTLLDRYALSICSGDFNEWISKVATVDAPFSYMFTQEWEIPEFDLGSVANHAEMAKMMAPRPFMVERGHRDGVGIDEWVAYEYAKVKRFYDEMGIGDRTEFEYFNGPHMIHGVGTVAFLRKHLGR
jgi:dienelactone hydrolase